VANEETCELTVSEFVVQRLIRAGVDHFFILVGGNAMYLHEAIRKSGTPFTSFHNEQSAAMAAEAYARLTKKLSCVVVTSGPGASNVVTGVAGAYLDSSPMIVICGNPKLTSMCKADMPKGIRQVGTFELSIEEICQPIAKFTKVITEVSEVKTVLERAIKECISERPGPAVLNFPLDIQNSKMPSINGEATSIDYQSQNLDFTLLKGQIIRLLDALRSSKRPAVMLGHGVRVSGYHEKVLGVLREMNLPIFTTQLAKDFIPYDDELFIGHVGVRGDRAGNIGIHRADVILFLGTSLHEQNIGYAPKLFAASAEKYVLNFQDSISGKNLPITAQYINADIGTFLGELIIEKKDFIFSDESWLQELREMKKELSVWKEPHNLSSDRINMYEFVEFLSQCLKGGETIITDAGLCFYIMGQAFKLKSGQRYLVSGGLGAMGYALPAAIGSSLAGSTTVVTVTGDGSLQLNIQELATLSRLTTRTKIFVINNFGYASIRNTQKSFFGELIGSSTNSGVEMPNWELIARAYGINYAMIANSIELKTSLPQILSSSSPQLIEVLCQEHQVLMPNVTNYRDESGNLCSQPLNEMTPDLQEVNVGTHLVIN
jgi:acetolactate synthase-1/2/3 large subunit